MRLLRLGAAAATAALFADAALSSPTQPGLSTFGRPPELALAWALAGAALAVFVGAARDRDTLGRRLTLVLMGATLLGTRAVPGDPGWRLVLLAFTLGAAAPRLRNGPASLAATVAVLLAVPALLGASVPHRALLWLSFALPPVSLALLVPALFDRDSARTLMTTLVLATGFLVVAALFSYVQLADGLELPLSAVTSTRLRVLGLHPNLAVPHLVVALVLGATLLWSPTPTGRADPIWNRAALLASVLVVIVALYAVDSRTGHLAAVGGLGLLGVGLYRGRGEALTRWVWRGAVLVVGVVLILPATGLTDPTIDTTSSSMVSKAVSFRSHMWELGRDAFGAAPWHGFGPGSFHEQGAVARPGRFDGMATDDHPHSVVLAVGEGLGWPGLLALAWLALVSLRPPKRREPIQVGLAAATLVMWASNAADLGGAANTLYPALVFLLLGLRDASEITPGTPLHACPGARGALIAASLVGLLGLALGVEHVLLRRVGDALERHPVQVAAGLDTTSRDAELADAERWLDLADRLIPFDPEIPTTRAALFQRVGTSLDLEHSLEEALARFPRSAGLHHRYSLVLSQTDVAAPEVLEHMRLAVELDPWGTDGWRRHLDLAHLLMLRGEPGPALDAVVAALLVNPGAAADIPRVGSGDDLVLLPAGPGRGALPLTAVLGAVADQRRRYEDQDAAYAERFSKREIEVLISLGETDAAVARIRELLADSPLYLNFKLGDAYAASGRLAEAREHYRLANETWPDGEAENFWLLTFELEVRSEQEPLDVESFEARVSDAGAVLADVVFDQAVLQRLLVARRRVAERGLDGESAARYTEALAFLAR